MSLVFLHNGSPELVDQGLLFVRPIQVSHSPSLAETSHVPLPLQAKEVGFFAAPPKRVKSI